jgi:hypothetical protein
MALCRAALFSVVPSGCFVRCVAEAGRKPGACVPSVCLGATFRHDRLLDTLVNLQVHGWALVSCLVQAALQGAAHTNHVVGEAVCPFTGWWLPGCAILLPEL